MRKHYVVCVQCGRQFNANLGSYYNPSSRRYTCSRCVRAQKRALRQRQDPTAPTGVNAVTEQIQRIAKKPQSTGAMIAKIAAAVIFFFTGIGMGPAEFMSALVIAGALVTWAIIPYRQEKKRNAAAELQAIAEQERARLLAERAVSEPWSCASCGAVTKGKTCEYCGQPKTDI